MTSFENFADIYYSNVSKNSYEYEYLRNEFNKIYAIVINLDSNKIYDKSFLTKTFFKDTKIKSQTSFYKYRRTCMRILIAEKFSYATINEINKIEFEDVFDINLFKEEYFASIEELGMSIDIVSKSNVDSDRLPSRALAMLLWDGLSLVEATSLQITDFENNFSIVNVKNNKIHLSPDTSKSIKTFLRNKKSHSDYLFSGMSGAVAHITTTNKMIKRLNDYSSGKIFGTNNIISSGLFYRSMLANVTEIPGKTKDIQMKYKIWMKTFYPNGIS